MPNDFPAAIESLRTAARAVPGTDLALLDLLLTAEQICAARYEALAASSLAAQHDHLHLEFTGMAQAEQTHALILSTRIRALGGVPLPAPVLETVLPTVQNLTEVTTANILAERAVIKLYRAALRQLGRRDKETALLLRQILDDESRHITGMSQLLERRTRRVH